MANDKSLLNPSEIKKLASPFIINMCATLGALSIFINSIGINLMQINTAITESIVRGIEQENNPALRNDLKIQESAIIELTKANIEILHRLEELEKLKHAKGK